MKAYLAVCAVAASLAAAAISFAQPWPSRPITIIVPFAPGGPTDTLARLMSEPMRKFLGQTVVVENVTGAGGSIGVGRVARATPDGYTVSIGHWGTHVVNGAYYNLNFDLIRDFAPVAQIATNPQLVMSKNSVPARNMKELTAWIKANQDKVQFATGGVGGASHIAGIYFMNRVGAKVEYVPYRGAAPALQALLSGEADINISQIGGSIQHVRSGRLRAYMVTAKDRQRAAPEIPTADEAGMAGMHTSVWHGIWVPGGTPRDAIVKLNAAIVEALSDSGVRAKFSDIGQDIPPREEQTPQALAVYHKAEIDKWWPLMRAAGIKSE